MTSIALGCEKAPVGTTATGEICEFTLSVKSTSYDSAEITVKHNGPKETTWLIFATTDTKKGNKQKILAAKLAELKKIGKVNGLRKSNNLTVTLTGLEGETEYKAYAIAISKDCKLNPSFTMGESEIFKTSGAIMEKVTEWSVKYNRRTADNEEEFSIVNDGNDDIYVTFINALNIESLENSEEFKEYGGFRIVDEKTGEVVALLNAEEALVYMEIMTLINYIKKEGVSISDYVYNKSLTATMPRKQSGEWLAVCIQCDEKGPTGYYSCDYITIEKETASEEYQRWLGNWTFKGNNDIEYTMEIIEEDPNFIYAVKGWECDETLEEDNDFSRYEDLYIPMYFDKLTGNFYVQASYIGTLDNQGTMHWGLYGWYYNDDESKDIPEFNEEKICETTWETKSLTGCKTISPENNFTYKGMSYIRFEMIDESKSIRYAAWNTFMEFPITMTRIDSQSVQHPARNIQMPKSVAFTEWIKGGIRKDSVSEIKRVYSKTPRLAF